MKTYSLKLECPVSDSFRCQKAANALDIDVKKKSVHNFSVKADLDSPFHVGLIVGASGSGKTTLCKSIFGEDCFSEYLNLEDPIIEQFPEDWTYEQCAKILTGVGLTAVPCWIRPAGTLSNGQRSRAEAALAISQTENQIVIDEWTSVVDRTVAKVMSHSLQKAARREDRSVILCACHYDIEEWLNPDWIIDCNKQTFEDRREQVKKKEKKNSGSKSKKSPSKLGHSLASITI
tara:strand:- start:54 stop:752 length:699 start_codon:yes stop_codon:yes gene_type:complete